MNNLLNNKSLIQEILAVGSVLSTLFVSSIDYHSITTAIIRTKTPYFAQGTRIYF